MINSLSNQESRHEPNNAQREDIRRQEQLKQRRSKPGEFAQQIRNTRSKGAASSALPSQPHTAQISDPPKHQTGSQGIASQLSLPGLPITPILTSEHSLFELLIGHTEEPPADQRFTSGSMRELVSQNQFAPRPKLPRSNSPQQPLPSETSSKLPVNRPSTVTTEAAPASSAESIARRTRTESRPRLQTLTEITEQTPLGQEGSLSTVTSDAASEVTVQPAPIPIRDLASIVEYAGVMRNQTGQFEFHLGLSTGHGRRLRCIVKSFGQKKIGLRLAGRLNAEDLDTESLEGLKQSLRDAGLEIVDFEESASPS